MQTKLLRFLQDHEIKRVGGTESVKVDVRIISATNQQLEPLVKEGRFREDLFYRLNVVTITLPPLRERKEDIPLLANHFVQKFTEEYKKSISHISPEVLDIFMQYSWPGNVRELENTIERAVIFSVHPIILPEDLPQKLLDAIPEKKLDDLVRRYPVLTEKLLSLKDVERNYVLKVLQETRGNKKKAAEILGIDRTTLYRILDKN
jgi:two-component system, NtrC family, response regulator AtoC